VSYVLGGSGLIAQKHGSNVSYVSPDALGSTRTLTNAAGNITDTYTYEAFGEVLSQTGTTDTNYLYAGQQFDEVTQLYSMRARYYDPNAGRFLARDTWAYNFQNPVELNRYVYAMGNPVTYTDPSGYTVKEYVLKLKKIAQRTIAALITLQVRITNWLMRLPPLGCFLTNLGLGFFNFAFEVPYCGWGGGGGDPDPNPGGNTAASDADPITGAPGVGNGGGDGGDGSPITSGTATGNNVGSSIGSSGTGGRGNPLQFPLRRYLSNLRARAPEGVLVRMGRWTSEAEYEAMKNEGRIQGIQENDFTT
jgi:RHS repeat-associated protein